MMNTPIVDQEHFNEMKALMGSKLATIMQYFLEDAEGYLTAIHIEIERKNTKAIAASAHTLKSSSRQMGAMRLSVVAEEIEYLAIEKTNENNEDMSAFMPLIPELERAHIETKEAFT